jgi:hypothetical protein
MRAQPLRDAERICLVRLGQQDGELLTAESAGQVVTAQLLTEGIAQGT